MHAFNKISSALVALIVLRFLFGSLFCFNLVFWVTMPKISFQFQVRFFEVLVTAFFCAQICVFFQPSHIQTINQQWYHKL